MQCTLLFLYSNLGLTSNKFFRINDSNQHFSIINSSHEIQDYLSKFNQYNIELY